MKKRLLSIALALSLIAPVCVAPQAEAYNSGMVDQPSVVYMGIYHSGAVDKNGSLWMWGATVYEHLCVWNDYDDYDSDWLKERGITANDFKPVKVMEDVVSVAAGGGHSAAIKEDGSLWTWGLNESGQLGNGSSRFDLDDYVDAPAKVMNDVSAVSLGLYHSAAIKEDGSLWMWGDNSYGELGTGDKESSSTPKKIMTNVAAVSLGDYNSAAIKKDGSLWMWGYNRYGQLGNGSTDDSYSPVKIMDNVVAVSIGGAHTAAIKKDGSLWMWGNNSLDQLGNGTGKDAIIPVKVMNDVVAVSLGNAHSAAIKKDGTLWTWGLNAFGDMIYGCLGDGTVENHATPVKVLNDVVAVSLGGGHSVAVKKDGSVWTWGLNLNGQLGLGANYKDYKYADFTRYYYDESVTSYSYLTTPTRLPNLTVSVSQLLPQCTITLNLNGGSGTTKVTCGEGGLLTPPNNPSRDGYFFAGWYKDKACKKPWNFDTDKVTGNCTLYAKWEPKSTTTVTAEPSTQKVEIDGKKIILNSYVLRNDQGYPVNFVKLRDIAYLLDGTEANFNVDWRNNAIRLDARQPYTTPNGAEMTVPTVAAAPAKTSLTPVLTGGVTAPLEAFLLTDKNGGGHNYFKLRDIGKVAGFNVEWDGARGIIVVTTTEDYIG